MTLIATTADAGIRYDISFPKAKLHYTTVEISLPTDGQEFTDFSMPVWTPGSYKVRDFSQSVDETSAFGDHSRPLEVEKISKNTWRVVTRGQKNVTFRYEVYNFVVSVRHSYVDDRHAFVHGVSTFMRVDGKENEKITLHVHKPRGWNSVEVALPDGISPVKEVAVFDCENFDLLADSPIALGNFEVIEYTSGNVPHRVVMIGEGTYDKEQIKKDFKKVSDTEVAIFNDHPSPVKYIHFIQNVESGGGGLEHLNCQTSQVVRTAYSDEEKYRNFVRLVAHEQFHLWNVKRIRPIELGPFNYDSENYTKQLWVAEGITSYYDDHILLRNGLHTEKSYLESVESGINRLQNTPGRDLMTLEESSYNAWIKLYLPNENSKNTSISYYNKGMIVAMILDLEIIKRTNGEKSFDDVLRALYGFYTKNDRGFTVEEFWNIVNDVAGSDMTEFWDTYIRTTEEVPYDKYFEYVGMKLVDQNQDKETPSLGIKTKSENGKCLITEIELNSSAADAGLSVNDEIIAIDSFRVSGDAKDDIDHLKIGSKVDMMISRNGVIRTYAVEVRKDGTVNYKLEEIESATEEQKRLKQIWLSARDH